MKRSACQLLLSAGLAPAILAVATTGCATKGFVRAHVAENVNALEAKTNDKINALSSKEQADISRVEEQINTTDNKASEAAASAQQANQLAQQNRSAIAANGSSIETLNKALSYSMISKGEVSFAFDKSNLSKDERSSLESLVQQAQSKPQTVFELFGFTDPTGSDAYNLALSRRRAESVARYLVNQGVSPRGIHIIGLGKEPIPQTVLTDLKAPDPSASPAESHQLARRVLVRIYAAEANVPKDSASLQ